MGHSIENEYRSLAMPQNSLSRSIAGAAVR